MPKFLSIPLGFSYVYDKQTYVRTNWKMLSTNTILKLGETEYTGFLDGLAKNVFGT